MEKYYKELLIEVINLLPDDVVRTSWGNDGFDDNYEDPNLKDFNN